MKHRIISVLLLCVIVFLCIVPASAEGNNIATQSNVISIHVRAMLSWTFVEDDENYGYITSDPKEIAYIMYYLNNLDLIDDGEIVDVLDYSEFWIMLHLDDGSVKECGFTYKRFYDNSYKQYAVSKNEYYGFLNLINALKQKRLALDDYEMTFEPSEWAKDDVEKAIDKGLVPKVNRIDYDKRMTRAEVCHLIYNLLRVTNAEMPVPKKVPFKDKKDDDCIKLLYQLGIINGKSEEEFCPHDYITREEFAKILSKVCDVLSIDTQSHDDNLEFSDQNKISAWALDYVNDVRSSGIMIGDPENRFNPQSNITKQEVITTLLRVYNIN